MKILKVWCAICLLGLMTSCSKDTNKPDQGNTETPGGTVTVGTIIGGAGVYVVGYEKFYHVGADSLAVAAGVPNVAKVWKDGIGINLTNGTYDANAVAVRATPKDVYVVGYEKNAAGFKVATMWKNGTATRLGDGKTDSYATSITLDGTDVYVTGNKMENAVSTGWLWKNGTGNALANCETANSVAVYNGNVYVCGSDNGVIPTLWTNGTGVNLLGAGVGVANWITISSTGVRYIGGDFENNGTVAGYWTNEKFKLLGLTAGGGYGSGEIKSVSVYGNDVYLLGFNAYGPVLWKNETAQQIDISVGATNTGGGLIAISVANFKAYMAGWRNTYITGDYIHAHDVDLPMVSANGTLSILDNGDDAAPKKLYNKTGGRAQGIFVLTAA